MRQSQIVFGRRSNSSFLQRLADAKPLNETQTPIEILGRGRAFIEVMDHVKHVAATDLPVSLISRPMSDL